MAQNNDNGSSTKRKIDEDLMEDAEAVNLAADWADISQGLRKDLGHQLHSQWIKPIQLGSVCKESGTLDLFLPTEFSANWVNDRFHDRLQLAWKIVRSEVRKVRISVHPGRRQLPELMLDNGRRPANDADTSAIAVAAGTIGEAGFTSSVGLDPSLTFAAFVTGETNILGKNAAERMAATEQPQFSPLYLKAATGQGKTHLLHAIGHAYLQAHPRARIFYCSAERFMVEFVQALKANQMIEFKARLRSFDLLLVDDTPAGLIARSRYHDAVTLVVEQPEKAASVLSELPQARKVELREGELTVFPAEDSKLLEVITGVIRENGWSVSELRLEAGRLDEVFRQVTRGEVS